MQRAWGTLQVRVHTGAHKVPMEGGCTVAGTFVDVHEVQNKELVEQRMLSRPGIHCPALVC